MIKTMVQNMKEVYGDKKDIQTLAIKILNHFIKDKTISKQEPMVLGAKLDLFKCSNKCSYISTLPNSNLGSSFDNQFDSANTFAKTYSWRNLKAYKEVCLHEYFGIIKNKHRTTTEFFSHYFFNGSYIKYPLDEDSARILAFVFIP